MQKPRMHLKVYNQLSKGVTNIRDDNSCFQVLLLRVTTQPDKRN